MDATCLFARNFTHVRFEDIPPKAVAVAKNSVLDTLGVALAGASLPGPKELCELVQFWGGRAESSIVGCKQKVPAPNAAQVNAVMVHARDYDDVHETAIMHPAVITIPVALALAEAGGGLSGKEFLTATALGADMICRLGLATRPGISPIHTGWHFTTLYGYPTAALTAGRLLGLDEDGLVNAFGIAYHQCSGNGQCVIDGALTKRLGPGFAVRGGMTAALMAARGITGARNCLEGENGLFRQYQHGEYDRELLVRDLGAHFEGVNVSIKPYPCCRGTHPSIDAALALVKESPIRPQDIKEIAITTGEANHRLLCTPFEAKVRPRNVVDAQFSIPWGVATALVRRTVTTRDYTPEAIKDECVLSMTGKIKTEADPSLNHKGIESAIVRVLLQDGQVRSATVHDPLGSPQQPMSFDDCVSKFHDCVALSDGLIAPHQVERIIELVAGLEKVEDVRKLVDCLV
jgi:2-methylcitrate dehydratase PrpD